MNSWTLTIQNREFREEFQESQFRSNLPKLKKLIGLTCITFALIIVNNFLKGNPMKAFMMCLILFLVLLSYFGLKKSFVFQIIVVIGLLGIGTLFIYIYHQLNLRISGTDYAENADFYNGSVHSLILIIILYMIGCQYYLKKIMIYFYGVSLFLYFFLQDYDYLQYPRYLIILTCIILDTQIYAIEKEKRENFLLEKRNDQWQRGLEDAMELPIIQAEYITKKDQLQLQKVNGTAKQYYQIEKDEQFKNFCREYKIKNFIHKKHKSDQNLLEMILKDQRKRTKQNFMTLERFIYTLQQDPKQIKNICNLGKLDSIFNTTFNLLGKYKQKYLHVKVFLLYDQNPIVILILEKEIDYEEIWRLKAKIKISENLIDKMINIYQKFQKGCLIYIKKLQLSNTNIQKKKLKYIQCQQYLMYNSILNIRQYYKKMNSYNIYHKFSLEKMFLDMVEILRPMLKAKKVRLNLMKQEKPEIVVQSYWKLFQITFNLVRNAIEASMEDHIILIQYKSTRNIITNQRIIQIQIQDTAFGFNSKQLNQLPIINPYQLWEHYINFKSNNLPLGLTVSSNLLRQIGPSSMIKVVDHLTSKKVKFLIYQDVRKKIENKFQLNDGFKADIRIKKDKWLLKKSNNSNANVYMDLF